MIFDLKQFLNNKFKIPYDFNVYNISNHEPDIREWLVTNGNGGYSSATICGANTRRYHGLLIASMNNPVDRHLVLSRIEENILIDGTNFELSTSYWSSGVISPTGYKKLIAFSLYPVPTWVFKVRENFLIKHLCLCRSNNRVLISYEWLNKAVNHSNVQINLDILSVFRDFRAIVRGASEQKFTQFVSPNHTVVLFGNKDTKLHINYDFGNYTVNNNWWWDYHYMRETEQALPAEEDLLNLGTISATLEKKPLQLSFGLNNIESNPDFNDCVNDVIEHQNKIISLANTNNKPLYNSLIIASDQFLVTRNSKIPNTTIEGYHWFNDSGRATMIGFEGLYLITNRLKEAKETLLYYASLMVCGLIPNRFNDNDKISSKICEYNSLDCSLWWGINLDKYLKYSKDDNTIKVLLSKMQEVIDNLINGTNPGIKCDSIDGLIRTLDSNNEFSWMDAKVANIPITHRKGKPIDINSLWYNFLSIFYELSKKYNDSDKYLDKINNLKNLVKISMLKFWNPNKNCAYDVIESNGMTGQNSYDDSIRPNQLLALSLPHRFFSKEQELDILNSIKDHLLTPFGLRTLACNNDNYQGSYGCGFNQADQYHRDISYHQGCVWPYLIDYFSSAYINIMGLNIETKNYLNHIYVNLFEHFENSYSINCINEIFDGNHPHKPNGAIHNALACSSLVKGYKILSE